MEKFSTNKSFTLTPQQKLEGNRASSFTLIELLIVIGILAVIIVAVFITINPAEYLKKSRDSKRVTDITSIDKSIGILEALSAISSYGTALTVYVSLPDTSSTCANLGLPTLPTGYTYHCVIEANLKKTDGTGWIPLDFSSSGVVQLSFLPIDPTNSSSTGLYYTYTPGGSYELTTSFETTKYQTTVGMTDGGASDNALEKGTSLALTPMVFPNNWVKVPGNSTFGTSDFWVMKYEAKYDKNGDGNGDDALTCRSNAPYDTWYYGGAGADCPSSWDNTKVVSTANGSPLAFISHTQAKTACSALGAHLITNEEWQTIARNAENVDSNWTGASVGSGYLFNGNSADTARGYDGADPEKGSSRNSRAKYTLSNSQEIYDISGNVWEHTMRTISDIQTTITTPSCSAGTGWQYCNFGTEAPYITGYGSLVQNDLSPQHSSYSALNQGVGGVYTNSGGAGGTVLLRGGPWTDGSYAGAFAATLSYSASTQYSSIGFRCAR